MEKEYKEEVSSVQMYEIYKTTTGLYIKESICNEFGIGNNNDEKIIKDNRCLKVNDDDIAVITQSSNNRYIPIYITIFDLQLIMAFNVFVDIKHNNDLYVSESLCKKNNITPETHRVIDGVVYCKVTEEDIATIEENTKNEKIKLQRKLIEKEMETDANSDKYLFMYYYDIDTNKSYITRETLELCKKLEVSIEGTPKIIDDKNCYSIAESELKEFEEKSTYRGIQRLVKEGNIITEREENNSQEDELDDSDIFESPASEPTFEDNIYDEKSVSELETTVENIVNDLISNDENFNSNEVEDNNYPQNDNSTLNNTIEDIVSDLENTVLDEDVVKDSIIVNNNQEENIPVEKPVVETVITYRDRRNNKLYIPAEYATNIERPSKTLMRTLCYETTMYDLERIYNKRIIIVDVFPTKKQVYNVIVCNNNGKFFVPEYTIRDLDIDVVLDHKIMVNKEIYVEITRSDLDIIKGKETKDLEINIELKHITPTKKRG